MFILFHPEVSLHFWLLWPMVWHPYSTPLLFSYSLLGRFNFKRQPEAPHNTQKKEAKKFANAKFTLIISTFTNK